MNSYSQHQEDAWIAEHVDIALMNRFCEVGAFDGVKSSNTLLFEEMGWTGLLVEADPELAYKAMCNRKAIVAACACGLESPVTFSFDDADRGMSGIMRKTGRTVRMVAWPLWVIAEAAGYSSFDVLSIDTEGTELDVWMSRGNLKPKIVIIEYLTLGNPPNDAQIVKQLNRDGYVEIHRTPINLIFMRER